MVMDMSKKNELTKEEKKQLQENYLKMVEAKLRKSEKRTWMVKDPDHLEDYHK